MYADETNKKPILFSVRFYFSDQHEAYRNKKACCHSRGVDHDRDQGKGFLKVMICAPVAEIENDTVQAVDDTYKPHDESVCRFGCVVEKGFHLPVPLSKNTSLVWMPFCVLY